MEFPLEFPRYVLEDYQSTNLKSSTTVEHADLRRKKLKCPVLASFCLINVRKIFLRNGKRRKPVVYEHQT